MIDVVCRSFTSGGYFHGDVWVDPSKEIYEGLFKRKGLFKCVRAAGRPAGWSWGAGLWGVVLARGCVHSLPHTLAHSLPPSLPACAAAASTG